MNSTISKQIDTETQRVTKTVGSESIEIIVQSY